MSSLRSLSNGALLSAVVRLASEERRITFAVLEHFREIERRKAYADLGYRSLFEYAISHLRYSEGSAARRIQAMHALKENPELGPKIESGETTVTAVSRIHSVIRKDEKLSGRPWAREEKNALFREMAALPRNELEQGLAAVAPQAVPIESVRPIAPNLYEVKVFLTGEEMEALAVLRAEYSHAMKDAGSNSELFRKLIAMAQAGSMVHRKRTPPTVCRGASPLRSPEASPRRRAETAAVPAEHRREVFRRAGYRCEEIDARGKRCDSRYFLQVEHRTPRALGGTHEPTNLQILCRAHNQIRGIRTFGAASMRR